MLQIDRQHRAATKLDIRRSVLMHVRIFGGLKVTTEEERFNPLEKRRVRGHHVDKLAVFRASLAHDNATVLFHNLCFDFARMLIH